MNYHEAARFIEQMDALCEPHKEEVNREVFLVQRAYDAGWAAGLEDVANEMARHPYWSKEAEIWIKHLRQLAQEPRP